MKTLTKKETSKIARELSGSQRVKFNGYFSYNGIQYHNYIFGKGIYSLPSWELPTTQKISVMYENYND